MKTSEKQELFRKIELGVRRGAARAQAEHKKAGRPIYVWKDGKVVEVPPEEIIISEIKEDSINKQAPKA